jgi:L-ascorbate metabolism protein UlaG (beta-lactamase superfamily)
MRITHVGHACVLVETAGARVLLDPGTFATGWWTLTDLDAVLVTHAHPDHVDEERLPLLLEANPSVRLLAEPELAAEMGKVGWDAGALHPGEEVEVAGVGLRAVGGQHAVIHEEIPRIGNVGFVLSGAGEPVLFHPGDSYDTAPDGVDVLALPLSAPWAKFSETASFLRAVAPGMAFPVHDALLSPQGREVYLRQTRALAPEGTDVRDLAGAGATEL